MAAPETRVEVRLYDTTKSLVAVFDDWRSLQWFKRVNEAGSFTFIMNGDDERAALFEESGFLEVRRRIPGEVDWYVEFGGLIDNTDDRYFQNGNRQFTATGKGYNGLLGRRFIMYGVGTVTAAGVNGGALKATTPGQAMYEYVIENIGANATTALGRAGNGVIAGWSYSIGDDLTVTWNGDRARKQLLEVLKEIADFGGVDFEVRSLTPSGSVPQWEFVTNPDQIGDDRSVDGLDTTTGLNGAGNAPVVFALEFENVSIMAYAVKHAAEVNVAFAAGSGAGPGIEIIERPAAPETGIARREGVKTARDEDTAGLTDFADGILEQFQALETIEFTPLQVESTLYGRDYFLGDTVTARWRQSDETRIERSKRLMSVRGTVAGRGETLQFTFKDV